MSARMYAAAALGAVLIALGPYTASRVYVAHHHHATTTERSTAK